MGTGSVILSYRPLKSTIEDFQAISLDFYLYLKERHRIDVILIKSWLLRLGRQNILDNTLELQLAVYQNFYCMQCLIVLLFFLIRNRKKEICIFAELRFLLKQKAEIMNCLTIMLQMKGTNPH